MRNITVVGASLAGLSTCRALRAMGYDGRVTLIGDEPHRPYDRPPLSKEYLLGAASPEKIELLTDQDDALELDWRLGSSATRLEVDDLKVVLSNGEKISSDAVILATGARARILPATGHLAGVHTLRTLEDSNALRETLLRGGHLVVIGAGFIGAEVASSARMLGNDVTVVEAMPAPLSATLGADIGHICASLHADHGVRLIAGVGVDRVVGRDTVEAVHLADGRKLRADAVVVGIGAQPNTDWLSGSVIHLDNGIRTDSACRTNVSRVVAVGDCASSYNAHARRYLRVEHWTNALEQPKTAVAALLRADFSPRPYTRLPYFWSDQYGARLQFAGYRREGDNVRVVEGSPQDRSFLAVYERDGDPVAVFGMNHSKQFNRWRHRLRSRYLAQQSQ
ncbi:NAD(P)/FAD-dependent oxidoreductase [Mycobacterium vicinigordonae]|uniref:FAD-dependent oxidoreductase n=1 Tax=Mycobacterium vicinigordonae TaxID=1719132 RepID=A0A7D6HMY5_9MYCO|nr:FAD-dependent oxidoreductase [Mycobacterium vicinigordonae]QLL06231.1 FAD-dependent oxidoreductase [Mycobacterium vicinigordonae]